MGTHNGHNMGKLWVIMAIIWPYKKNMGNMYCSKKKVNPYGSHMGFPIHDGEW
jgi:hypothetical protein